AESHAEVRSGRPNAFIWRLPAGPQEKFLADHPVRAVFSPNGKRLVTIGEALDLWSLPLGRKPKASFHRRLAPGKSLSVDFDETSGYLLINATVGRLRRGEIVRAGEAGSIAHFSTDGWRIALAPGGDEGAAILDAGTQQIPPLPFSEVVAISDDGRRVATQQRGG